MSSSLSCPACAGPIDDISPLIRSVSCPHCGNLLYFNNSGWLDGGKFSEEIAAPALLRVDRQGSFAGDRFRVAGRVRLSYEGGSWDEWWLEFENGNDRWLEEDDGAYHFHSPVTLNVEPAVFKTLKVGQVIASDGQNWFVTESGSARVMGVEGQIPVTLRPGFTLNYFDVVGDGKEVSIEVWDNEVEASMVSNTNPGNFNWD